MSARRRGRARGKGARRGFPAQTSSARLEKLGEGTVRLNKYLADHGVASRRACDELIAAGKVMVDDQPVTTLGTRIDPWTQRVEVDGVLLKPERGERRYYVLNKPAGVVCTNEVREQRPRAIDLITDRNKGRIYTVGRLDEDSKGLILLTNDGEFAQRIAHPRHGVIKTYRVRVQGKIPDEAVQKVRQGVHLSEGKTAGARILVKRRAPKTSTLLVSIQEGKNREVRRIFARVGYKVVDLVRTDIGPLNDRGLKVGSWRALTRKEVEQLLALTTPTGAAPPPEPTEDWSANRRDGERPTGKGAARRRRGSSARGSSRRGSSARGSSARGSSARGSGSRTRSASARGGPARGARRGRGGRRRRR